jgi:hypothetical protein
MSNIKINTDHIENITKWNDCTIEIAEGEILAFNLIKTRNGSQNYSAEILSDIPEEEKVIWEKYIVNRCKKDGVELKTQTHND